MQVNPSSRSAREDESVQRAVLCLVLAAYPKRLTIPRLANEIDRGDAVERAVRDLVGAGLLEVPGHLAQADAGCSALQRLGVAMSVAQRFGVNLARCRKTADMSQEETSVRAGLHRTEISQLERGLRLARVDTVAKLAAALEIEPGELFEGIVWMPGTVRYGHFAPSNNDRSARSKA